MGVTKRWTSNLVCIMITILFSSSSIAAVAPKSKSDNVWAKSFSYETAKNYAEAARVLEPILKNSPNDEFTLLRLGWLNYLQTKYNASFTFYKKALDLNADSIDARLGLTLPLLAQLRWKEAAIYANEVIAISAWDFIAHTRLMTSESALQQWDVLEKHASEVAKRYPSDPGVFIFLARAQAMQAKKTQAIENYTRALERAPTNQEALNYLKK